MTGAITSISTDAAPAREKVAFWRDMVCQHLIQVDCTAIAKQEEFSGAIAQRSIGRVDISHIQAGGQQVARTATQMARADQEFILVNIQREGLGRLQQDGRETILRPGDAALYSSARRYDMRFDTDFRQTVLVFPAESLRALRPGIDSLSATTLERAAPATMLLTQMADAYYQLPCEQMGAAARAHAATALTEVMAATVAAAMPGGASSTSGLAHFHLARIKQYVAGHLHEPELSVGQVALALQLSVSHIHRLFGDEQHTFSVWMWSRRLLACRLALENPSKAHLPVSQIAYQYGFNNSSHFSRAFRNEYGSSPRGWRSLHAGTK